MGVKAHIHFLSRRTSAVLRLAACVTVSRAAAIAAAGYATVCPVVALDAAADAVADRHAHDPIKKEEPLFTWQ